MVFSETAFYATLAPMLPGLESDLGISQSAAGLLGAAYPLGMVLATIPAGVLADRSDPRFTARVGIAVLALSSLAFGFGQSVVVLDAARLVQGAAAAAAWAGALAALAAASSAERRGAELGTIIAAAFVGTVIGPAVGVLAESGSRAAVFVPLAALLLALAAWGGPVLRHRSQHALAHPWEAIRERAMARALAVMVVVGVVLGGAQTLGAIFLADHGVLAGAIALVFIAGYSAVVFITPLVGRSVDRHGPVPATAAALVLTGVTLLAIPLVSSTFAACVLLAAATLGSAASYTPVAVLISQIADSRQISQGLPMALTNGSWALGAAAGAAALNAIAEGLGDVTAFAFAAALCAAALFTVRSQPRLVAR